MLDINSMVRRLKRPLMLVQTARYGVEGYRRDIHLRRILGLEDVPGPTQALVQLLDLERFVNEERRAGYAGYKPSRHVEILIAIMAETRILNAARAEENLRPHIARPAEITSVR